MWHSPMSAGPSGMRPISVSEGKANTALRFKRPSKALDDVIAAGGAGLRLLAVKDITPLEAAHHPPNPKILRPWRSQL